ncbi:hypothetical protein AMELA_G00179330 [Ameiurus melas]|uniref:Uncharacterized protein n=1 Tax=Ameiurus melas TaxID=219545 RepID=A0A7J6AA23_AMEME|nr:hypothetical protein AMELA_G00179330 [Ameiurus melas]
MSSCLQTLETKVPALHELASLLQAILTKNPESETAAGGSNSERFGRRITALLDTGSIVTLACPSILPAGLWLGCVLAVTCVHGDTREVLTVEVQIEGTTGIWPLRVGVIPDLPVPLLLGSDWPGFPTGPTGKPRTPLPRPKRTRTRAA